MHRVLVAVMSDLTANFYRDLYTRKKFTLALDHIKLHDKLYDWTFISVTLHNLVPDFSTEVSLLNLINIK